MKIYRYDNNGIFYSEDEAYIDPEETKKSGADVYMLPANSTFKKPPELEQNELAVFKEGNWNVLKDYRGQYVCDSSLNIELVNYIGNIKDGFVLITKEQAEKILEDKLYYIVNGGKLVINPDYDIQKAAQRETLFKQEFFNTSLGWIRRKVNMKDGTIKDFLADLLLPIKAGLELEQKVEIITYKTPDFNNEYTSDYIVSLQERKNASIEFIQECLIQTVADFSGKEV